MINEIEAALGNVKVTTADNYFHTAEDLAEMALNDIITESDDALPTIKDGVNLYREAIRARLVYYFELARKP